MLELHLPGSQIGGMRVSPNGEDTLNVRSIICQCPMPVPPYIRYGVPISFWEPVRLVDVTREPYCLVAMGGVRSLNKMSKDTEC